MISRSKGRRGAFATIPVVASAVAAACSGGDFLEPESRQASAPAAVQQIAVPAYFDDWSGLLPDVPPSNLIVVNPNNGPDPGYASQISAARARGARVVGYVYTRWANTRPNPLHGNVYDRTVAAVKADIDRYYSLYPSLDGIFLDEVTGGSDCAHAQSYYQPIYDHIQSTHPGATVVINPGAPVDPCYLSVASIVVTFESSFADYQNAWSTSGRGWETPANAGRIWHIVHTASSSQWSAALDLSRTRSAGYVFVTSFTEDENTFGALPSYFQSEAANVRTFNAPPGGSGGTALSRWSGWNDGVNVHYRLHFSQPFTFYRVYIDRDRSAATGFAVSGMGADYLIENSTLYAHGGSGWSWTPVGGSGQVTTASSTTWTVSRAAIGETASPNSASLSFEAETVGSPIQNTGRYEHVYSASSGAITGYFAENDANNVYYQANFASAFAYKHVFIDTDMNAATGYAVGRVGADYMIENDRLYRHAGGGWSWTQISSVPATGGTTGTRSWTVPRATLGETAASGELAGVVFHGSGGFTEYTAPSYRHVYTP
jgi:Spherulation-specific family 4